MKDLVSYIVNSITGEKLEVEEMAEEDRLSYVILAPEEVIGLIIGKEGKTIKAIRNLLKVRATLEKKGVSLSVEPLAK